MIIEFRISFSVTRHAIQLFPWTFVTKNNNSDLFTFFPGLHMSALRLNVEIMIQNVLAPERVSTDDHFVL